MFEKKETLSDLELLEAQKSYKIPFMYYFLKNKWWQILLKIGIAYLFSLALDYIEAIKGYSFWASYVFIELILYNYFSKEEFKP